MKHSVYEAQATLRARYKETPAQAMVADEAYTCGLDPTDPFHSQVKSLKGGGAVIPFGVHQAVGGPYDAPCPGDLLCAALAACQDSSIRMVANLMGIELIALEVQVKATVDVRGAMGIDMDVPVGFQSITCNIHLEAREGTPPEMLEKLRTAAQRCCVVGQTLLHPPQVKTLFMAPSLDPAGVSAALA